ncbi:hypothetical protein MAM1_1018c11421 [Mucor ambiguus]|uniref:Uncharacterized protein n=1 Tax=Mucor ambiguus TaxID=91626 RepID=A0A0C9MWR8_9FUNG|nr:hypothetical protein MAM1_1018c11421 [Mucor ambiguus]
MSSTIESRFENILTALERLSTSLDRQAEINQKSDQRFAAVFQRLEHFESRFTNLETLLTKTPSNSQPTPQPPSAAQPIEPNSKADAIATGNPQSQPRTTWANIAAKPPAPLNDRKRQALHRMFNPPAATDTQNGSYTFVYLSRSRRMNRSQIRSKFRDISIDNLRILDLNFPARNAIGVLLHEAYLPEFKSKLLEIDARVIEDFNPLDHHHIADPKYQDLSVESRANLAKSLHRDRCIRTLYFIRPHLLPGVAKYFVRQGWVSNELAQDIMYQRLPRPAKRRVTPPSGAAPTIQSSQPSGLPALVTSTTGSALQAPPSTTLHDWFGNPVTTQEMDITPDFASNASGSVSSRPSSPISDAVDLSQ